MHDLDANTTALVNITSSHLPAQGDAIKFTLGNIWDFTKELGVDLMEGQNMKGCQAWFDPACSQEMEQPLPATLDPLAINETGGDASGEASASGFQFPEMKASPKPGFRAGEWATSPHPGVSYGYQMKLYAGEGAYNGTTMKYAEM